MHRLLTTTAVALLLGSLPALAAEDSYKTPDQSQSGNVTQSGETPGGKQATEPPGADTSGGAPPSAGVSSATEPSDISGDALKRAKELNRTAEERSKELNR